MLVPISWLRDFLQLDVSTAELSDAFNDLGLVVESITESGHGLDDVVSALVRGVRKHPNADRMRLIDVVVSEDQEEPLQVACGAFNFEEGDRVALAKIGAVLPGGFAIERAKKRGEWSNGMLCSARELGLGDDHAGILVLAPDTPLNVPIAQVLGVVRDAVFDLNVEANRPDALCIAGIARDLAAKLRVGFTLPTDASGVTSAPSPDVERATIAASDLCDRLTASVIRGVVVTESPDWIKARLVGAGMRPVNNLVDASNYVMLELGAPSHAFDLDTLAGGAIGVRWARPGEEIVTLDGITRILGRDGARDGVIVDGNDVAVGVAAIMGGQTSEVVASTTSMLLEVAHWTPMAIARTAKRLGIRTDASARFERGTDPEGLPRAAARVVELISLTCPNVVVESYRDVRPLAPAPRVVEVRTARVNRILGTAIDESAIEVLLTPIGFACRPGSAPETLVVTIPPWRPDATGEIDVIEEIGRHFGYRNIPRQSLVNTRVGKLTTVQLQRRLVGSMLAANGCDEVWTATLVAPSDSERSGLPLFAVELSNPLVKEESVLRSSLVPGLLRTLAHNANHRSPAMRLFEIGRVFEPPRPEQIVPYERQRLTIVFAADGDDARCAVRLLDSLIELLRVKRRAIELTAKELPGLHATRSAHVLGSGTGFPIGSVGEIDPSVLAAWGIDRRVGVLDVDLENLCNLAKRSANIASFSKFP